MFCDGCGATLNPSGHFCQSCGKPVIPSAGLPQTPSAATQTHANVHTYNDERVRKNIGALTAMWLVYGILRAVGAVAMATFGPILLPHILGMWGPHAWPAGAGDWGLGHLLPFGIFAGASLSVIFALAYFILAYGLSERRPWARTLGIVLGFLILLRFPFGTALGAYTLWVLLPDLSRREYDQLAHA